LEPERGYPSAFPASRKIGVLKKRDFSQSLQGGGGTGSRRDSCWQGGSNFVIPSKANQEGKKGRVHGEVDGPRLRIRRAKIRKHFTREPDRGNEPNHFPSKQAGRFKVDRGARGERTWYYRILPKKKKRLPDARS